VVPRRPAAAAHTQVLVHNVSDLEMLLMHNRVFCAEVSS
jgi:ribosomal protein L32E